MIKENCFQKVALTSLLPNVINMIINIVQVSQFKIHALCIDNMSFLLQKGKEQLILNAFPNKIPVQNRIQSPGLQGSISADGCSHGCVSKTDHNLAHRKAQLLFSPF